MLGIVVNVQTPSGDDHPPRDIAYFACCVTLNIICTIGIVVRLWRAAWSNRSNLHSNDDIYLQTVVIIMESGAIFTAISFISLVTCALQTVISLSTLQGFINVGVQTAVVAPLLILVRAHFGISHGLGPVWSAQRDNKVRTMTTLRGMQSSGRSTTMELQSFGKDGRDGVLPIDIVRETLTTVSQADDAKVIVGEHDLVDDFLSGRAQRRHSDLESSSGE